MAAVANNSFVGNQCPSNSRGSAIQIGAETILLNNNLFIGNSGGSGSLDLGGSQRLIGAHVDIGAYESDVLLRDGFGP